MRKQCILWLSFWLTMPVHAALPFVGWGGQQPSLAPMLERITPAVVNISNSTQVRIEENPLLNDPFFRFFFNIPEQQQRRSEQQTQSLGSGVVIDAVKGYVVTNNHVIEKADKITVTLQNSQILQAELVGADPETDIALLKVPPQKLTAVPVGNSEQLRVGDFVVAIGNPFGLGQTVTSGIVSALGRSGLGIEGYEDFIQTDASINPGNSGGALVNLNGELIGINTAILSPGGGGNVGIGFAIPVNMMQLVIEQLKQYGEVQRGMLGAMVQDLTPDLAAAFGLPGGMGQGAVIVDIEPNSSAQKAGLQRGDIIVAINNSPVNNATTVRNRIGLLRVGQEVALNVLRRGQMLTARAVVAKQAKEDGSSISPALKGASFTEIELKTPRGMIKRVQIKEILPDSPAWEIGLRQNDIILSINRNRVQSIADLTELMNQSSGRLMIKLLRGETVITILLR